jgi:hypothetical protein
MALAPCVLATGDLHSVRFRVGSIELIKSQSPFSSDSDLEMSSGFVSGGSLDAPTERDEEWLKAQRELVEERASRAKLSEQQGGKSLFEILQANKG